ncbi:MAG TPA: peptidoglycan editing factor PgeF [Terracidiphilus sp.]
MRRKPASGPDKIEPGQIPSDLKQIDALFEAAGLRRSRRQKAAGVAGRARFQDKTAEELRLSPPATRRAANGVEWIPVPGWQSIPWLWHGFSTRRGGLTTVYAPEAAPGELNLGFTPDDPRETVLANRRLFAEAVSGKPDTPLVTIRQFHSSVIVQAGAGSGLDACKGDGVITGRPGILLGVQTADCTPVLVADRRLKVVAAFHAGWRGTARRIVENGIGRMRVEFGCRPEDMIAAVGPGIGACCYQVGEELLSEFESQFAYGRELFHEVYDSDPVRRKYPMLFLTQRAPGHSSIGPSLHLDVGEANRRQLLDAGLKEEAIQVIGGCTSCHRDLFFSHRGSNGRAGRMLSAIGIAD